MVIFIGFLVQETRVRVIAFTIKMKKDFKDKFPKWAFEDNDYTVCLSDDLDSLAGASILKEVKGWEIKHFYNFNNLYSMDKDERKAVGVDIALENGRTYDNHLTKLSKYDIINRLVVNPNVVMGINRNNYTDKYQLSTALLMWSLYDIPLPKSDEGKLLLLCIDSGYKGHFNDYFRNVQNNWLEMLSFEELIDIQNKYTIKDFIKTKIKYKSQMKILLNDGFLSTRLNLNEIGRSLGVHIELPKQQFYLRKSFERSTYDLQKYETYTKEEIENHFNKKIFSMALTGKHTINLTLIK